MNGINPSPKPLLHLPRSVATIHDDTMGTHPLGPEGLRPELPTGVEALHVKHVHYLAGYGAYRTFLHPHQSTDLRGTQVGLWVRVNEEFEPCDYTLQGTRPDFCLSAVVRQTEDWPYGDQVPLFEDYLASSSTGSW